MQPVFTERDNDRLEALPGEKELRAVVRAAHHLAVPGTDSIPSLLYHECWDKMAGPLMQMVQAIFRGAVPTMSQRTSLMVFGSKPKHPNSLDPVHKRRISLINIDMKLVTGIDAARFHQTATHTLSPCSWWQGPTVGFTTASAGPEMPSRRPAGGGRAAGCWMRILRLVLII